MYFGADYYPEHWSRERWDTDAKLMRDANFNIVRLAEFSWSKIEPTRGEFDFGWLDEVIDILAKHGIGVIMSTPTATPPKWIMDENPGIYMEDIYGHKRGFGSRRHYCCNNAHYREHTARIVGKMAEYYRDNINVVAWQIDNEFGCHDTARCYCNDCLDRFKRWLMDKYQSIEEVNQNWGSIFWSQTYRSLDELIVPAFTVCSGGFGNNISHNPGLLLDFYRFSSDSWVDYQRFQIDILRKAGCRQPITHNFMGHFEQIDYFNLGKELDFISWDNYPDAGWGKASYLSTSMAHDLMRGVKQKNFWMMEQQSGPLGWNTFGGTPRPGQLRLWSYQSIAHGAEALLYFRWRACTFGAEQLCFGILDHDGIPRRRYEEIKQVGEEFGKLSDWIVDSEIIADVAIIKSYDNLWSFSIQSRHPDFNYNQLLMHYYNALSEICINPDIISIDSDFSRYKLVIMPAFSLMTQAYSQKIEDYVSKGGHLIISFFAGLRNLNNTITEKTLPGYFRNLSGVLIEEFDCLNWGRTVKIEGVTGKGTAAMWCDILKTEGAQVVSVYCDEFYKGKPAITVNNFGNGKVYYIGCDIDQSAVDRFITEIVYNASIKPVLSKHEKGIEVVARRKNGQTYIIALNHLDNKATLELEGLYENVLTGERVAGIISLDAYDAVVLRKGVNQPG